MVKVILAETGRAARKNLLYPLKQILKRVPIDGARLHAPTWPVENAICRKRIAFPSVSTNFPVR
jgi:hypothetical protein